MGSSKLSTIKSVTHNDDQTETKGKLTKTDLDTLWYDSKIPKRMNFKGNAITTIIQEKHIPNVRIRSNSRQINNNGKKKI